ncbi:hypothetical protein, partial [Streptomyces sp. NRRL F-6674]|uniref:hypothetical protein n=1 Tax=Streptomyces sp. NRRL F-6674 TaxID=1463877 RepID=UPI000524EA9B
MTELPKHPYDEGTSEALSVLVERVNALAFRSMDTRLVAGLRARGEYDAERHHLLDKEPLSEDEHLALLAYGEAIARSARHPSYV